MASRNMVKVAVLGASGYSGIEAVRILARHPFVELSVLTSEHYAGREVSEVYRHLAEIDLPPFEELRADLIVGRAEVVMSCMPERVGAPLLAELVAAGLKVLDLSADFRLKDPAQYRQTYGVECTASPSSIGMNCARRGWWRCPDASRRARCWACCRLSAATWWNPRRS
jgi:N-acetyl-gamma-glutamylphosphate reductase